MDKLKNIAVIVLRVVGFVLGLPKYLAIAEPYLIKLADFLDDYKLNDSFKKDV